jgi:hypothetical protein
MVFLKGNVSAVSNKNSLPVLLFSRNLFGFQLNQLFNLEVALLLVFLESSIELVSLMDLYTRYKFHLGDEYWNVSMKELDHK